MRPRSEGVPKEDTKDAERLERKRAAARRYVERHKDEINERRRRKRQDPAYREEILAADRDYYRRHREEIGRRSRERWRTDAAYREKLLSRSREWNHNNRLTVLYGMTRADYERMLERQGGACAICKRAGVPLCVDHCHKTGEIRGLLCHRCNLALGCCCDDPDILLAAVAYLRLAGRRAARRVRRRNSNGSRPQQDTPEGFIGQSCDGSVTAHSQVHAGRTVRHVGPVERGTLSLPRQSRMNRT